MDQTQPAKHDNIFWIHLLRITAALGVIMVHVTADVITEKGAVPDSWWWIANFYDAFTRGCVATFIMVSGSLLLGRKEGIRVFFQKRFDRVFIPFLAWTILYVVWKKLLLEPNLGGKEILQRIFEGKIHYHLWFIYSLTGLYLMTPIFRILVAHAPRSYLIYFLMLWFCFTSLVPFLEKYSLLFFHFPLHLNLPVAGIQGLIGYFVLGHLLRHENTDPKARHAFFLMILSWLVCFWGLYFTFLRVGSFKDLFYDNLAPNVVFYSASFFILVKRFGSRLEKTLPSFLRNLVLIFSKASLGIYLIHPMILEAFAKGRWGVVLKANLDHPLWMIPLTASSIYLCSFALIYLIQKIPYLRQIT